MKNLSELVRRAEEYAEWYVRKYNVDAATRQAIFVSHLAMLLNEV